MTRFQVQNSRYVWISICGLLLLMGANSLTREASRQRRERIARMSPNQKAQLQQNFELFQNMTREEQDYYRNLHQDIHSDRNIAKLRSTMMNYHQWAKMLPPAQRDELRNATDVSSRIQLIQKYRQEEKLFSQKSELSQAISTLGSSFHWLKQLSQRLGGRIIQALPLQDFDAMIAYLEKELPQPQRDAAGKLTGLPQSLEILSHKLHLPGQGGPFLPKSLHNWKWIDERQIAQLIEQISDPVLQKRIRFQRETNNEQRKERQTTEQEQRESLARLLLAGLIRKVQQHIQSKKPSEEELLNYLENDLDANVRDEIYLLPADQSQRRLLFLYLTEHADQQSQIDQQKLRNVMVTLALLGGMRPRGPEARPPRFPGRRPNGDGPPPRRIRNGQPFRLRPQN